MTQGAAGAGEENRRNSEAAERQVPAGQLVQGRFALSAGMYAKSRKG
jgi:hypothetical protein